jgi:hypothetical protein
MNFVRMLFDQSTSSLERTQFETPAPFGGFRKTNFGFSEIQRIKKTFFLPLFFETECE